MNDRMNLVGVPYPQLLPFADDPFAASSNPFFKGPHYREVHETLDVFSEILMRGRVCDPMGLPIAGARVEMWHPTLFGQYGMDFGPSVAPIDPDSQGWCSFETNALGEYFFKTEKRLSPCGQYVTPIDLKISHPNGRIELSRIYFYESGEEAGENFWDSLTAEEQYEFAGKEGEGIWEFNIMLP